MFGRVEDGVVVEVEALRRDMFNIPNAGHKPLEELKDLGILPITPINNICNKYQRCHLEEYIIKGDAIEAHHRIIDEDADTIRKIKESESFIMVKDGRIDLKDKSIYNLQAYIASEIPSIRWKCDCGLFIDLTLIEYQDVLTQLMLLKSDLYREESNNKQPNY